MEVMEMEVCNGPDEQKGSEYSNTEVFLGGAHESFASRVFRNEEQKSDSERNSDGTNEGGDGGDILLNELSVEGGGEVT
eukprot:CAMPEP_0185785618 /NCGR_PEP_ID=MMETSP1174-20130828/130686_1 /TAXON_ID=35687 /ORGANISM="Dictyocha speculum, Strain CCMP1381" /LENGTH=78 /DNA_ID=CAMNT_0028477783 /DNA_START=96 /DNA_END=329 /DNA_ORIENTATION=-